MKWRDWIERIVSFGPKKVGCNLLINKIPDYDKRPSVWPKWVSKEVADDDEYCDDCGDEDDDKDDLHIRENDHSIVSGFQLATNCGPICNEPLMGVAVILSDWRHGSTATSETTNHVTTEATTNHSATVTAAVSHGPMSGQLMSAMKEGILKSFNQHPRRLMVAMYSCEIQV